MSRSGNRRIRQGRDEALGIIVSCIGAGAILAYVSPALLPGPYGWVLGAGIVFGAIVAMIGQRRSGGSFAGGLFRIVVVAGITAASMFGLWWYFFVYIASQPSLFDFSSIGKATEQTAIADQQQLRLLASASAPAEGEPGAGLCGSAIVQGVELLNLRSQPSLASEALVAIPQGQTVQVLCDPQTQADSIVWQKVRSGSTEGWMSIRFLSINQ